MVTINNITPQGDNTQVEYTVNFEATNHNLTGSFVATKDEFNDAFKTPVDGDVFGGIKKLVLTRLANEAQSALGTK